MVQVLIDDKEIDVEKPGSVIEVALEQDIYIPHLCYHPGLMSVSGEKPLPAVFQGETIYEGTSEISYEGCGLCIVEIEGRGLVKSCGTAIEGGMVIRTTSKEIKERRREILARILENHPHDCLMCEQAEGCDRKICSKQIEVQNRCCWKFGACEFQKLVDFIGIDEKGINAYTAKKLPLIDDNPLFTRNYNLCIGCLRCVVACRELGGANALGFVYVDGNLIVGTRERGLEKSGCKFCLACVEVCPTGALRDKNPEKQKSKIRREIPPVIFPPEEELMILKQEFVETVPEVEGVYKLWNEDKDLYQITGTDTLQTSLFEELRGKSQACYFNYEEEIMYTSRERQLIQQHLKKTGKLPLGNDEDDELF